MKKVQKKKVEDACKGMEEQCEYLRIDETDYKTLLSKKFKNRKTWQQPDDNVIASVIPGTVLEIFVKEFVIY